MITKIKFLSLGWIIGALLWAGAAGAGEAQLLTDNGLSNSASGEYKAAPHLRTGGRYVAEPAFSNPNAASESFAIGRLTDGDASFQERKPLPYAQWTQVKLADLTVELLKNFRVRRVRVCINNNEPNGVARIELFKGGDVLEFPELLKLAVTEAKDGWNTFDGLDVLADSIRLRFTAMEGRSQITVSEVEVWGVEAAESAKTVAPVKSGGKAIHEGDIEWYAFDFGPTNSPVFANFTGVSKDVVYTSGRGYGFQPYRDGKPVMLSNFGPESAAVPGLGERDRLNKKRGESLYRDFVAASASYHTQVRQTFLLDVPNGHYRVVTFHADYTYGRPGEQTWWIDAEGKRVVEKVVFPDYPQPTFDPNETPADMCLKSYRLRSVETKFETDVTDGQLTLDFDSKSADPKKIAGVSINGLVVLPINTPAQKEFAERKIAFINAEIERERKESPGMEFTEKPWVEEEKMPSMSDADQARGYVTFVPQWMTNIYPSSVPRPADMKRPLGCFACPGEYEPMVVAFRALKPLKAVKCTVSDLKGPGAIPAAAVDVRIVRCWPQRIGSSWGTEWRVMPELLEARESVDVAADKTQEFWLTIRVPSDAKPGIYNGTVTIRASDAGEASIPMTVEVLPFTLQPNERPVGMYWFEVTDNIPLRDAQIRDMVAHGMTTLTMGRITPAVRNDGGKLALDTNELCQYLRELRKLGIQGPIPFCWSPVADIKRAFPGAPQDKLDELYVEAIRRTEAAMSPADMPKLLYYPVDEIGGGKERGEKAQHECALIAKVPGATSYITVNDYKAGEKWGDTFDIWCGNVMYTAEQEQKLLARGKRYMRYSSAYNNDARKTRACSGFGFYRRPAEAMFYWHYQSCTADPFNDFDGESREHCAAYPGPNNEQIPTTDWEAIRESVDDMRYIATLKHYATLAAKAPEGKPAADRALAALADVMGGDENLKQGQSEFRVNLGDDDYQALRRKLVDAILALKKVLPER